MPAIDSSRALELAEESRQRDRIGATRERHEHTIAPAHERKTTNRIEDALGKCDRFTTTNRPSGRGRACFSGREKKSCRCGT